jgi:hypothetical protein
MITKKTIAIVLSVFSIYLLQINEVLARTPIGELRRSDSATVSGEVASVVGNEFILTDGTGEIIVDAGPRWWHEVNLVPGERVTVVGEYDDYDFDAYSITRSNGEVIKIRNGPGRPPWAGGPPTRWRQEKSTERCCIRNAGRVRPLTVSGSGININSLEVPAVASGESITGIVEKIIDNNDFILNYGFGRAIVDLGSACLRQMGLALGDTVSISVREIGLGDIDAAAITLPNGSTVRVPREGR